MKIRMLSLFGVVLLSSALSNCGKVTTLSLDKSDSLAIVESIAITKSDEVASMLASPENHEVAGRLERSDRWADDHGAITSPSAEVNGRVKFNKQNLFSTVFLYGFDLQYSSDIDLEYELVPQATAVGHVPATFRRNGDVLQLVADQSRLFESDINRPEALLNEYKIVEETPTTITVVFERSGMMLNAVFNGAASDVPKQTWIRSLKYDESKSLLLQESGLMLPNGAVQTFMESLFPRASLVPEGYVGLYADSALEPLADRYRFLSNESVYMPVGTDGDQTRTKTALVNHYNLGENGTIDFYVTPNAPDKFMPVIRSGIEGWNRYFEPQLGRKVMRFLGKLPEGISIGDPRFNVVNWDNVADAGAAYESSASDPTTGIQSHSLVYLPFAWYNIGASLWKRRVEVSGMSAAKLQKLISPKGTDALFAKGKRAISCARTTEGIAATAEALIMNINSSDNSNDVSVDEFAQRLMIAVLFHEVGHSLGLNHNFKASLSFDGTLPVSEKNPTTWSAMDYNYYQHELDLFNEIGGTSGPILEYDRQFISQVYNSGRDVTDTDIVIPACNDEEADDSSNGVDPLCQRYDSDKNPINGIKFAFKNVTDATSGLSFERKTLAESLTSLRETLPAKFSVTGTDTTPAKLIELASEVGNKVASLSRYYIASGAQSVRGNFMNNDKLLRFWRPDSFFADGLDEASARQDFHSIAKESLLLRALPEVPAASLTALGAAIEAVVKANPSAGVDDATRASTAISVREKFAQAVHGGVELSLSAMRSSIYQNLAFQEQNPFAIKYAPSSSIADFEGWSSSVLSSAVLVGFEGGLQGTIESTESERIVAAQVLRTFAGVSDDVSGTLGKLKDLVRLGRQAGNQAQVDAARRALKVLE